MNAAHRTALLLVVVIGGTSVSAASCYHAWPILLTYLPALVAGMACGRITRIVRDLDEAPRPPVFLP